MEVAVRVVQAWIKDTQRFKLRCRVQAAGPGSSGEAHEGSVSVAAQPSPAKPHQFSFSFASRPTKLSLLFLAESPRYESHQEKELGRCTVTLSTTQSLGNTETLFLSQQMPDTKVERFVGKLKCEVNLSEAASTSLTSLLSDEAERACVQVLPSESPSVSVVFHCVYARVYPSTRLVGVARIGDRSDISVGTLLQQNSQGPLHCLPILKPVRLSCQEFDCLELHIGDSNTGSVQFSCARALSRLTPFRPTHFNFDSQNQASNVVSDTRRPSVSTSVSYTPSDSQFGQFEGIEVAVCEVSPPRSLLQCRDIVMGAQLVQPNSKGKFPTPAGHSIHPPFQPSTKKSGAASSEYHVSVLRYQGREVNPASVVKFYHLFCHSLPETGGLNLIFQVFGSSGTQVWWDTDSHSWAGLEISEETLPMLQKGDLPILCWSASNSDSSQPCTVSGVLRWKLRKTKFLSESSVREILNERAQAASGSVVDPRNQPTKTSPGHFHDHRPCDPATQHPPNHESSRQIEGVVSPEQSADAGVLKEFFHQMTSDFNALRTENQRLQTRNEELRLEVARLETVAHQTTVGDTSYSQSDLQELSKSELKVRVWSLQKSLEDEKRTSKRYRERIGTLQGDLAALRDVEARHIELREAHMAQQRLIQTLRDKVSKYRKCSEICRKQEGVITQLESLLAKQARGHPSAKDDAISLLGRENAELRTLLQQLQVSEDHENNRATLLEKERVISSLKSQLSQLASHCKSLERERDSGGGGRSEEKQEIEVRMFELEQKVLVAEAKLSAQSRQLQENAEKWMVEKAGYELQLAEYRSQLDTVVRSGKLALAATKQEKGVTVSSSGRQRGSERRSGGQQYFSGKTSTKDFSF